MTEKSKIYEKMSSTTKQQPTMKLFAAWEVDRTPPNCVPRLCSLTITRLSLLSPLPPDLTSLSLAVKMQSSKRTLRSHEIPVPQLAISSYGSGVGLPLNSPPLLETELDLHFSLQYPHFLKRDGNRLLILLQRRKKYKTRTILGYKTLAEGVIRMDAVLQKSMDMTVELSDTGKSGRPGFPIATLRATQVSSMPVDSDNKNNNSVLIADRGNEYSDEDEEQEFSSNEDNEDGLSGYAAKRNYESKRANYRKLERNNENDVEQRNFKQKIVALLKRFRPEELEGEVRRGQGRGERDLDALFQELESLSCGEESGQDVDSISLGSTPKPSLRPFFQNSKSMLQQDNNLDRGNESWRADSSGNEGNAGNTDPEAPNSDPQNTAGSPPKDTQASGDKRKTIFRTSSNTPNSAIKKKQSLSFSTEPRITFDTCLSPTNVEPRKSLLEQLTRTFATDETALPDVVSIVGPPEPGCISMHRATTILATSLRPLFQAHNTAEIKAILQSLMNKIQKYCNSTAKPPSTVKVLLIGGDWLQGSVLRHYVDLLGSRPPDWVNHIRFFIVPIGSSAIARYLSLIDNTYGSMFGTDNWQQLCFNTELSESKTDAMEILARIQRYLHSSGPCTQIPVAEAMVNYKDEDSCQIFVPFISDVRLGCPDGPQLSLDLDEAGVNSNQNAAAGGQLSSSPPNTGRVSPTQQLSAPVQELQVDYWPLARPVEKSQGDKKSSGDQGKNSVKSTFRNLQVWRLPLYPQTGEIPNGLTVCFATKEKKQKIMRLGKKKEKDRDADKEQCIDGVARLICSAKQSHPVPLRVYIDGTEWTGVKFFQLSSQWQTHVKNFPVALIGAPLASSEVS
ncbi:unnamed protein product [Diamesa serratosioi]